MNSKVWLCTVVLLLGQQAIALADVEEQLWSHFKGIPVGPFELDLGVSLRLRGELQGNFDKKMYGNGSRDEILLERLRVALGLRLMDGVRLVVQGQDAHELGCNLSNEDFPNGSPYNNHFDLRQAFLEWSHIGGTPIGFKIGRQSIAFADNRVMGPGEWGNVGRYVWDAAVLTWRSDLVDLDLFYASRVRTDPAAFDHHHFDYGVLGFFSTLPADVINLHVFYVAKINGSDDRHSIGASVEGKFEDGFDLSVGLVPQFGRSVSALGGYAVIGYTAPVFSKPRIGLHLALGSGDSNPDDGTSHVFDGLFGAVDRYYGRMNLLSWRNIHDIQLQLSARPMEYFEIITDYHLFVLSDDSDAWYLANGKPARQDVVGEAGQTIGHEVDLVAKLDATDHAQLQVGFGVFVPGALVRNTGSHGLSHWGFLQGSYGF